MEATLWVLRVRVDFIVFWSREKDCHIIVPDKMVKHEEVIGRVWVAQPHPPNT